MLHFDVITLFPRMFDAITEWGISARARTRGCYELVTWNPRDFASGPYRQIDDRPYGGGPGMVMMAPPLEKAIAAARQRQMSCGVKAGRVVCLSPQGALLEHRLVAELAALDGLVLLAGRYEGIDERLIERSVEQEVSVGDYVVSGGELPAMLLMDSIIRHLPGALGDPESAHRESFVCGMLDHPQYTRPETHAELRVPDVLLSGNHAEIERWRMKQSLGRTWQRRPDLLARIELTDTQKLLLEEYKRENAQAQPAD